jgi:hypothetical protein
MPGEPFSGRSGPEPETTTSPDDLDASRFEVPTTNLAERAEALRRSAARFAANSAGTRATTRRPDVPTPNRT